MQRFLLALIMFASMAAVTGLAFERSAEGDFCPKFGRDNFQVIRREIRLHLSPAREPHSCLAMQVERGGKVNLILRKAKVPQLSGAAEYSDLKIVLSGVAAREFQSLVEGLVGRFGRKHWARSLKDGPLQISLDVEMVWVAVRDGMSEVSAFSTLTDTESKLIAKIFLLAQQRGVAQ
jgi:hypothetical protein